MGLRYLSYLKLHIIQNYIMLLNALRLDNFKYLCVLKI